jgi:hypothetical protein
MLCKYNPLHPGGGGRWYFNLGIWIYSTLGFSERGYTHKLNVSTPTYAYKFNQMKKNCTITEGKKGGFKKHKQEHIKTERRLF